MYRYFLIPYAGGSSRTFNSWKQEMKPEIDFQVVELAGHGKRLVEGFYSNLEDAYEEIYQTLYQAYQEDGMEYYIGGHCLGAVLAVEVIYRIYERKEFPLPKAVFISGHGSVKYTKQKEKIAHKTQEEMIELLQKEGGLSKESMQKEILELLIPVITADAKLYESYGFDEKKGKLPVDMVVMYGKNDMKSPLWEVKDWLELAGRTIMYIPFETDHYFILHEQKKYIQSVKGLCRYYMEEENGTETVR